MQNLTRPEAAAYLGISASRLAKLAMTQEGPAMLKLGYRCVRYTREALDAWLLSRTVQPRPYAVF